MAMKVKMLPPLDPNKQGTSGIDRVIEAYYRHLPTFGVTLVALESKDFDLVAGHIGQGQETKRPYVAHIHGLHWTGDYSCSQWQYQINQRVINACRGATEVTVPSAWVAEPFQRDMRLSPHVVPHGIDWDDWQHSEPQGDYVLWNKNRDLDVCNPMPVLELARRFHSGHFVTTFLPRKTQCPDNTNATGLLPHDQMKRLVQSAYVYLSTTKETFGIGVLEAMASGVPVLGYAHGGNVDLIEHGVTGYLAQPDNVADLAEGLNYCLKHRDVLGANGREVAKRWTWQAACEQVAQVYERALAPEPATVAIVIPTYNKSEQELRRAVQSAQSQTYKKIVAIVVVDDGSQDATVAQKVAAEAGSSDSRVRLVRQNNSGVAVARNQGIANGGKVKYAACLDADDHIGPRFVETCIKELEADRSLGIVYSALKYYKPDGETGISPWPDAWDFDRHLKRQNQVPTCCVFRRKAWEQLGGYRQRYAPRGCGAEDAELWLRFGAYGWKAKLAEPVKAVVDMHRVVSTHFQREATRDEVINRGVEPEQYNLAWDSLFHYSWLSGYVTGDANYREVDWMSWHPWTRDNQHPFASYATPEYHSHQVRQYDEPAVSVIIPVGPGHEQAVINALDSLEAQTFRKWEVIVVWDCDTLLQSENNQADIWSVLPDGKAAQVGTAPLASIRFSRDEIISLRQAYPYIREVYTLDNHYETKDFKTMGAGYARNRGAEIARAPFLVFLDADDWLHPDALKTMLEAWGEHKSVIYTDYMNRSLLNAEYLAQIQESGRLEGVIKEVQDGDEIKYLAVYWSDAFDYDCRLAQRQPELDQNGHFYLWTLVTTLVPKTWHDAIGGFDEAMKSFEDADYHWRLARAGHCYHRVPERLVVYNYHTGGRRESGLQQHEKLIQYLRDKYERIPAVACSSCGGNRRRQAAQQVGRRQVAPPEANDENFVLARYSHPTGSISKIQVTGAALFEQRLPGLKMRNKGNGWSIDYGNMQHGEARPVHRADIAAMPGRWEEVRETIQASAPPAPKEPLPAPAPVEPTPAIGSKDDIPPPPAPSAIVQDILGQAEPVNSAFDPQKIPGVGPALAKLLLDDGIDSLDKLFDLGVDGLKNYRGVGEWKAGQILKLASKDRPG